MPSVTPRDQISTDGVTSRENSASFHAVDENGVDVHDENETGSADAALAEPTSPCRLRYTFREKMGAVLAGRNRSCCDAALQRIGLLPSR